MKKLITIAILLLSLTSSAQFQFKNLFKVSDTLERGIVVLETKYVGMFVNALDTIEIELYLTYNPKDKFVNVEGIFITEKKPVKIYQFVFKNSAVSFKCHEKSTEFFTTSADINVERLMDELKVIRKNGVAFLPVSGSSNYLKLHTEGFEKIKCDWW
jgi:hypothetical protein